MRNFKNFADMLQNFPVSESPGQPPLSSAMPDELAQAAQQEALEQPHVMPDALNKAAQREALQQAAVKVPVQNGIARDGLDQAMKNFKGITPEGTMAKTSAPSRGPAGDISEDQSPEVKQKNELGRLEKLMQQMNEQRKKEMEDAASRNMKAAMLRGVTDNLGLLMAGSQAMNTKAGVQAPNVKSIDIGDQIAQVERKFKPEQEQLLAQYKELKDKNGELSEKDKAYLALGYEQLKLGSQRANDANNRFYEGEGNRMYKFGVQQDQKDEYTDKQTEGLATMEKTVSLLNDIEKELDTGKYNKYLGPYASNYENAKKYNPLSAGPDSDFSKFQSNVIDSLSQYIKGLSGLTVTVQERKQLENSMPTMKDKPQEFRAKLQATTARLQKMREKEIAALAKYQGKTGKVANRQGTGSSGSFEAPVTPANDPRVDSFMKKNGIKDRNEAIKILKDAGKI